jgi:hypothetical protein
MQLSVLAAACLELKSLRHAEWHLRERIRRNDVGKAERSFAPTW